MAYNIHDGTPRSAQRLRGVLEAWLADPIGELCFSNPNSNSVITLVKVGNQPAMPAVKLTRAILGTGLREAADMARRNAITLPVRDLEEFCRDGLAVNTVLDEYHTYGWSVLR